MAFEVGQRLSVTVATAAMAALGEFLCVRGFQVVQGHKYPGWARTVRQAVTQRLEMSSKMMKDAQHVSIESIELHFLYGFVW